MLARWAERNPVHSASTPHSKNAPGSLEKIEIITCLPGI
jgi:hypothetical protein